MAIRGEEGRTCNLIRLMVNACRDEQIVKPQRCQNQSIPWQATMHKAHSILPLLCYLAIIPWGDAKAQSLRRPPCSFSAGRWIPTGVIDTVQNVSPYTWAGASGQARNVNDSAAGAWPYIAVWKGGDLTLVRTSNDNPIICDPGVSGPRSDHALGMNDLDVYSAAMEADPSVTWQTKSILSGDFTCEGKREFAILGTTTQWIAVAIFRPPSQKPLAMLLYSAIERRASSAVLTVSSLDYDIKKLEQSLGWLPDGLQRSKTCLGLNLSDQLIDSIHIYWHRSHGRFKSWSL